MAVLTLTAGLTGVLHVDVRRAAHGLLIGDLRRADVGLDLELTQQAVDDDLQMELAHARDDGLAGLGVGVGLEGRILLGQLHQGNAHLLLSRLGFRLNGDTDDRLGEFHRFEHDGVLFIAEGIAGGGVFDTDHGGNVAGIDRFNILAVICVHQHDAAHTLARALGGVQDGRALVHRTGIDPEEAQLADVGVGRDLEGQRGEGSGIVRRAEFLLIRLGVDAVDALLVQRGRHIIHDRVQKLLHALVLIGRTAGNGNHLHSDGRLADRRPDLLDRDLLAREVQLHDLVVLIGNGLKQLFAVFCGQIGHVLGDLLLADVLAQLIIEDVCLHFEQVDDALKGGLGADGKLDGNGVAFEPIVHHFENVEEIRTHDVHLIHIDHPRHVVFIGLSPDGFGLRLNAALGAENGHRAVEHAQGALDLDGEIDVTRGIDDVDPAVAPEAGGSGGRDRDAALLLLLHPVHNGVALVGLAQLIGTARVEQDALRGRGLTGVDMRHNTDISCVLKTILSRHCGTPLFLLPTEMGEGLVGFCHLVGVFALLHGSAGVVAGVHDLAGKAFLHGLFAALAGIGRQPTQTEGLAAFGANLQRNLIGRAADTAGLDLQGRHDIFHSLLESFQTVFAGLLLDDLECFIDNSLCDALFTVEHHTVDELGNQSGFVDRIRKDLSLGNITSSGHFASLLHKKMIS